MASFEGALALACVLVVGRDPDIPVDCRGVGNAMRGCEIKRAASAQTGRRLLSTEPSLLVLATTLPHRQCLAMIHAALAASRPPIVLLAGNRTDAGRVARLLQAGADDYLEKPVSAATLLDRYRALSDPHDQCRRLAQRLVGRTGLKRAQILLRHAMHGEALVRAKGSRRAAAKLLDVDRRYIQLMQRSISRASDTRHTLEDD